MFKFNKSILTLSALTITASGFSLSPETERPNVVIIITDDQGYGDLGFTGNPHVKTPVIDDFARESIRFNQFYVSPVCAPTRASLMTGRYSLRTGVRDTYQGGALMATEEITVAEILKNAGYQTGLFGKWHLGDSYPFRPMDQGFDESLIHLAGGMGQPGDFTTYFKGDSSYFDPVLWYNGEQKAYDGYCSDIFTDEAIGFIEQNHKKPFFWRLPALFEGNQDIETVMAHIDLFPTLAELCNAEMPTDRIIDGKNFLPLLYGKNTPVFENRPLFFYWTRRYPELYNNIALQKGPFRLIGNTNFDAPVDDFELFNFVEDEFEQQNILASNRSLAAEMKKELDRMIHEITNSVHLKNPQRIIIGSEYENPVYLNRNDALGTRGIWTQAEIYGFWKVKVLEGSYNIRFGFIEPLEKNGRMFLETNSVIIRSEINNTSSGIIQLEDIYLSEMECDLTPYYSIGGKNIFPLWVELEKLKDE